MVTVLVALGSLLAADSPAEGVIEPSIPPRSVPLTQKQSREDILAEHIVSRVRPGMTLADVHRILEANKVGFFHANFDFRGPGWSDYCNAIWVTIQYDRDDRVIEVEWKDRIISRSSDYERRYPNRR
jgi:hypothetical protein